MPSETRASWWIASAMRLELLAALADRGRARPGSRGSSRGAVGTAPPSGRPSRRRAAAGRRHSQARRAMLSSRSCGVGGQELGVRTPRNSSSSPRAISKNRDLLITSSPARFIRWSSRSTSTRSVSATLRLRPAAARSARRAGAGAGSAPGGARGSAGADRSAGAIAAVAGAGSGGRPRARLRGRRRPARSRSGSRRRRRRRPAACSSPRSQSASSQTRELGERLHLLELLDRRLGRQHPRPGRPAG